MAGENVCYPAHAGHQRAKGKRKDKDKAKGKNSYEEQPQHQQQAQEQHQHQEQGQGQRQAQGQAQGQEQGQGQGEGEMRPATRTWKDKFKSRELWSESEVLDLLCGRDPDAPVVVSDLAWFRDAEPPDQAAEPSVLEAYQRAQEAREADRRAVEERDASRREAKEEVDRAILADALEVIRERLDPKVHAAIAAVDPALATDARHAEILGRLYGSSYFVRPAELTRWVAQKPERFPLYPFTPADFAEQTAALATEIAMTRAIALEPTSEPPATVASSIAPPLQSGDLLDQLRRECGWTVEQLAEKVTLHKSTVQRHLSNAACPHPDSQKVYVDVFNGALRNRDLRVADLFPRQPRRAR